MQKADCSKKILTGTYYAHSLPDQPKTSWQRLDIHLIQVAEAAAEYAHLFGSAGWAWNAGLLHDIGKATKGFQNYLNQQNALEEKENEDQSPGRGNHSSAGTSLAEIWHGLLGRTLAYIVAGHHAGLPDFFTNDGGMGALENRLKEGVISLEKIPKTVEELQQYRRIIKGFPSFVKEDNFHFWVRMLFSCLVDADFLDTEAFMQPDRSQQRITDSKIDRLKDALDDHMAHITCNNSHLKEARADVLAACRKAAKKEPGLFSLTVPTGGGKTLAAMTFALDHAAIHDKRRVIYVIPYTSIIEQTADVLGGILGFENIVEHHSNLLSDKDTFRNQLASENWEASIVVTTNVQFYESLYAARPSRCRKLHNLVNSVVILDEAQLVPPQLLSPCEAALNELVQNYGVTVVLSTATQPTLSGLTASKEIIPSELNLYERLQRTQIEFPNDLNQRNDWKTIAGRLCEHEQVLCIVNTRRDCFELYGDMPKGTIHLSASMCGEHRSSIIKSIKQALMKGDPIRVISTQLVEAGVDIDFPIVFRALSGLDSIVQAAGRCNREGKLDKGKVVVFVPPKSSPKGLLNKGECALREIVIGRGFDPQLPEWHSRYFDLFYNKLNDTGKAILKELTPNQENLDVAFRSTAGNFHLIDDKGQVSVVVLYGKSPILIEQLRLKGPTRKLMRQLQRYTINIPLRTAEAMQRDGRLEVLEKGITVQTMEADYRDDVGFDIFAKDLPFEELII